MSGADAFARSILAVEGSFADLEAARRSASIALAEAAAVKGRCCPQLLIKAAELITELGDPPRARELLGWGLLLDGPTAPVQHAYGRHCRAAGDLDEARRWLRGAMLRARPTAALALELGEIELALGDEAAAIEAIELAIELRWIDPIGLRRAADRFRQVGRTDLQIVPLMMMHLRGAGDAELRAELAAALSASAGFDRLPASARQRLALEDPATVPALLAASAHDRLLAAIPTDVIARARDRETTSRWIRPEHLWNYLKEKIRAGEPFSFIRAGDGEGRFIAAMKRSLVPGLAAADGDAMLREIWLNWFGEDVGLVERRRLTDLAAKVDAAFGAADLVGLTSSAVLDYDRRHAGYRSVLELWFEDLHAREGQVYTDAAYYIFLNDRDPFLSELLSGARIVGLISPHPELAARLARHLNVKVESYVIPGETRLQAHVGRPIREQHFPERFEQILASLTVPHRGACFLVAGGLLGKIYCARIRELGGIALDIGALADGWMGYNTRGQGFQHVADRPLPASDSPA